MAARVSPPATDDEAMDIGTIRSRLKELAEGARIDLLDDAAEASKDLIEDCLTDLLNARHGTELDDDSVVSLGPEDSEAILVELKMELTLVEDKRRKIENEITSLRRTMDEDSAQFYGDFRALEYSLQLNSSMDVHKSQDTTLNCEPVYGDPQGGLTFACEDEKFKMLQLDHQLEKANCYLSCLKNLDSFLKWDEAISQVEDIISDEVKVTEFEGKWIRMTIRTPVSLLVGSLVGQKLGFVIDPSVLYHELAIEVSDDAMELKNIEIFPNDVCLDPIISAVRSSRQLFSLFSAPLVKSHLEWLVRKVKQQIFLCNLRRLVVKDANNSRHSFEYSDKDETIIAHLVRGIDAVMKVSQGWPMSPCELNLVSIKSPDIHSKGASISFFYKVKELANLLDVQIRCHLPRFADAIEEIFMQEDSTGSLMS